MKEARAQIHSVVQGNEEPVTLLFVALAAGGHVLIEGIPGVGKTTLAKTFATVTGLRFARVQVTPDLMPTDITGHTYFDQRSGEFLTRKGPAFTNVLLADEINRTPPRTQAALLEVMQERQVTIEGTTHPIEEPFLVIATKNPIELEGVYKLPEAELDRFLLQIELGYQPREIEASMLQGKLAPLAEPKAVPGLVAGLRQAARSVRIHPDLVDYLLDVVDSTRRHPSVDIGASPRASEHFLQAARAHAAIEGRDYIVPDDLKKLAVPVLAHRLVLAADAEIRGLRADTILQQILANATVPIAEGKSPA